MKKFLLAVLIMIIAVPAFAKDPKETKEYWVNKSIDDKGVEMLKCWNKARTYFIVPVGSKQWNICCAILAASDSSYESEQEVSDAMIRFEKMYKEGDILW